jgi:glycosyltransferase involved in cell wall biosynthesis
MKSPTQTLESPNPALGASRKKIRIAHFVSQPVQYLVPIYREISKNPDVDFTVYYYSDESLGEHFDRDFGRQFEWSTPLLGGYKHAFLPSVNRKRSKNSHHWPKWGILVELARQRYDVLWINSYVGPNACLARIAAFLFRTPVFFRDDTNLLTPRPLWKQIVKQIVLRGYLRGTWALYVGEESRKYWEFYGIPARRLFFSPHCVDNDYWSAKYQELTPRRVQIRKSFGILDDCPVILFCGKFIAKKQPLKLLAAFSLLRKRMPCWLLMVGDGNLRQEVETQIRLTGIENTVLPGFLNQDELPFAYVAADIFVLPSVSNETWGLVVNEAMNFGLPIIVSDRVGCGKDLVREGWNGYSFPHEDEYRLADRMAELVSNATLRRQFGKNSLELISQYSVPNCASGIVRAGCAAAAEAT